MKLTRVQLDHRLENAAGVATRRSQCTYWKVKLDRGQSGRDRLGVLK
jgi:hypothetical protein